MPKLFDAKHIELAFDVAEGLLGMCHHEIPGPSAATCQKE